MRRNIEAIEILVIDTEEIIWIVREQIKSMMRQAAPRAQDMTCRRTKHKNYVDELQREEEPGKSESESESGTSFPHTDAGLWIRKGEIPGFEEEPPPAVRLLRARQSVSAPQNGWPSS
jgi:hypothetical protein